MIYYDKAIEIQEFLTDSLLESENFKNYRVYFKVKDNDKCLNDYIVLTLDSDGERVDNCDRFINYFKLKLILVQNCKSTYENLKIIDYLLKKLYCKYNIASFSILDSFVSESRTALITNLSIIFNGEAKSFKCKE